MKKILSILLALAAVTATAQTDGTWKSHPKYVGSGAQNLVDAGNKVYLQSSNHLFALDKSSLDIAPLDKDNGASDLYVTGMYYYADMGYTVVIYNTSNIDVIRPDGKVVNIPDIKDAIYNYAKGINDVTFAGGMMYLATDFGLVTINANTLQVKDTYYYNRALTSAAMVGNTLVVSTADAIYYDTRSYHDNFDLFIATELSYDSPHFVPIDSTTMFMRTGSSLELVALENTDVLSFTCTTLVSSYVDNVQRTPTGYIANAKSASRYYTMDEQGGNVVTVSGGSELYSTYPGGDGTLWAVGTNGVHVKGQATYYKPNGWGITNQAFYSAYNPGDGKVYVSRSCDNAIFTNYSVTTEIWTYDSNEWRNATPVSAPSNNGNYWLVFEPGHKCSYFYSTRTNSIAHVVNDTVVNKFTSANSPLTFMNALRLDNEGNLWGVQSYRKYGAYTMALPKDKLHSTDVTTDDWITPNVTGTMGTNKRCSFAISKGSDVKVYTAGDYNNPLLFWDNEGDVTNLEPKTALYKSLPDADGKTVSWQMIRCLTPDNDGNVWAGYTSGFFYFDPAGAFSDDFKINRLKIKMNSDSETDYFLEGESVQAIAVDSLDRKWLGTATQGVYLLSADNQLLGQFDVNNSSLPSNNIYSICPKPNSNSVIFVTSEGIAEYLMGQTTTVDNYDDVQAYPNPLRPDHTGYVTISNLVNDSYVKITDRRGNTVATLQAQGTSAKWDGCDAQGERMATGVYNVYAGPDADNLTEKAVTQIRIIK